MADAAHTRQRPFADITTGREYFGSEAHYRHLAAAIREQLQQRGGFALLSGVLAPNAELLTRQLTVVGSPRCRATVLKCNAATTYAEVMANYRKLAGGVIASWSSRPLPSTRGQEIDILVLDHAGRLAGDVLDELCHAPKPENNRRPTLLLLADESTAARLAVKSSDPEKSAIIARFQLDRLAPREVSSFIRYQLNAADLHELDIFKSEVIELIEIYADGDPVIVNNLARRILRSARSANQKYPLDKPDAAAPAPEPPRVETIAAAPIIFPSPSPDLHADVSRVTPALELDTPPAAIADPQPEENSANDVATPCEPLAGTRDLAPENRALEPEPPASIPVVEQPAVSEPDAQRDETAENEPPPSESAAEQADDPPPESAIDDADISIPPATEILAANVSEDAVERGDAEDHIAPRAKRSRIPVLTVSVIIALVIGLGTALTFFGGDHPLAAGRAYLDDAVKLAKSFWPAGVPNPPSRAESASVAVPQDNNAQSLRTTTDEPRKSLLVEGAPSPSDNRSEHTELPAAVSKPTHSPAPAPQQSSEMPAPAVTPAPTPAPVSAPAPVLIPPPPPPSPESSVVIVASPAVPTPPAAAIPPVPAKRDSAPAPRPRDSTASTARPLSGTDAGQLLQRGDQLLASGDIIAARHFFELVAESGDGRAALRLGKTYDPAFLQQSGVRGIPGNPATAKFWYLKAIASGDKDADMRLLQLMALYPE